MCFLPRQAPDKHRIREKTLHATHKKRYVAGFWAQDDEESMDEEGLEAGAAAEKRLSLIFELEMHTF